MMLDDIEALTAWQNHPDTNRAAFEALFSEALADADYAATMTVISVIMREES